MHVCGGAIINKWQFLTAAHCVFGRSLQKWSILAGNANISSTKNRCPVFYVKIHELYKDEDYQYDIAIVTVKEPFDFWNPNIGKIHLESQQILPNPGDICEIAGWGFTDNSGSEPILLRNVQVPLIEFEKCKNIFENWESGKYKGRIYGGNICAGAAGKDSCGVKFLEHNYFKNKSGRPCFLPF